MHPWVVTVALAAGLAAVVLVSARGHPSVRANGDLVSLSLRLQPREVLAGATAGLWNRIDRPGLILFSQLDLDVGRIRALRWERGKYDEFWSYTGSAGFFDTALIRDVTNDGSVELITLWRAGSGGWLEVLIFERHGDTFRKIWTLSDQVPAGQLLASADLRVRRASLQGDLEMVIRAPVIDWGTGTNDDPWPHQVSVYRWDKSIRTFVLVRRHVDPTPGLE